MEEKNYMTFADPIGDMITRIRNAQMRLLNNVKIPSSKYREKILEVLKKKDTYLIIKFYQIHLIIKVQMLI